LSGALYGGDGASIVQQLHDDGLALDVLQTVGDGLVVAFHQKVDGVEIHIARCLAALDERGWDGDRELMHHLESLTGEESGESLKPLTINLEELAGALEGDPLNGGGRIDLSTGEVWPDEYRDAGINAGLLNEDDEDDLYDPDRWLVFSSEGSHAGFNDMEAFIATVSAPHRAELLDVAIEGRGPFRRFRDVIKRWDEETYRWLAFSDERKRGRARKWLAGEGYRAMPPNIERA
jgi:hypothetical protein